MLPEFWGGAILNTVSQAMTLLVMGGVAGPIPVARKLGERGEARAAAVVAAVVAAVHASAGAGTIRIVGITRLGAESPWRAAGRLEALGMELERGQQWHSAQTFHRKACRDRQALRFDSNVPASSVREAGMKSYRVTVDGQAFEVTVEELRETDAQPPRMAPPPVSAPPRHAASAPRALAGERPIPAPLPGKILAVNVEPGDTVAEGAVLLILEAMKMENDILAPAGGTVKAVKVQSGDTVMTGDLLVVIE